jgi:hypothetical protein
MMERNTYVIFNNATILWGVPQMGVPQNGWFIMEHTIKIDDLIFGGTPISGNLHILIGFRRKMNYQKIRGLRTLTTGNKVPSNDQH